MRFKIVLVHSLSQQHVVFLSEQAATELGIFFGDSVKLSQGKSELIATVMEADIPHDSVGLTPYFLHTSSFNPDAGVDVTHQPVSNSLGYITKKLRGQTLTASELKCIVNDIVHHAISEAAISYFVAAVARNGLSLKETEALTQAMVDSGTVMRWKSRIVADKHCVGGIPGNRTTPIVIAICAAAGLVLPKTSSRAITSAAGTADTMEVLTHIALPTRKIRQVVESVGACLVWGGSLGLDPADDLMIQVERQINLDPKEQIVASILSKKIAAGSTHVLIDIPCGVGAKVSTKEGKELAALFKKVAKHFNMVVEVVLTSGTLPIGKGIGPVLEAIDILSVLQGSAEPQDLREKSIFLAGKLLEITNKAKKGTGQKQARKILDSGMALKKFNEILVAQGRKNADLVPGPYKYDVLATVAGKVFWNNQSLNHLARILGCPERKKAGLLLHVPSNVKSSKGQPLLTMYGESQAAIDAGIAFLRRENLFTIK